MKESEELATAIAAEEDYLKEALGRMVVSDSSRPRGCVVLAKEATTVQLPSGGNVDLDVLVAVPAAAVATGVPFPPVSHLFAGFPAHVFDLCSQSVNSIRSSCLIAGMQI